MQLNIIPFPHRKTIIAKSDWGVKKLADVHLEALLYCESKCCYCSSNAGRHLVTRPDIAAAVQDATGVPFNPHDAPDVVIVFEGIIQALEDELAEKRTKPGKGLTLVFSQLTDGFSSVVLRDGTTRRLLELLIEKTEYRIRILTKNAVVGTRPWIEFFQRYPDRFVVGLSIGTLDNQFARRVEAKTSAPTARVKALRALQDAGVTTYGMLCPVFPAVLQDDQLEQLLDAIRPDRCEHVWAEPYNDRQNWRYVRDCFQPNSFMWNWLTEAYESREASLWSRYTTELYSRIRRRAIGDGWIDQLNYLLYEDGISNDDAATFRDLKGVLLQSPADTQGLSRHTQFAQFQAAAFAK